MTRPPSAPRPSPEDSWDSDDVWQLLDNATNTIPSPHFAADTLRTIRLAQNEAPWWKSWLTPAPVIGLATAAAAVVLTFIALNGPETTTGTLANRGETAPESSLASIQEYADAELLSAAVDHLDDFSDHELVSLIGF
jgi:hypothetical protein